MSERGSVTVFLSFMFLVIMSLVLVLLEGARSRAAAAIADMQLTTCVESFLGEYYRPLYEKYSVFGIDTSFDGKTSDPERLAELMAGYAGGSSFGLSLDECDITATRPFLTPDGDAFFRQVVEYEKYCAAVDTIGSLLERFGVLSKESGVYKLYERQMEIEDRLAVIDRNTLLLMEKIDGLVCNGACIGEVHELFVKSFMTRGVDPVSAGINNPDVWMLLEDKYFNPVTYAEGAAERLDEAVPEIERRDEIKKKLGELSVERKSLADAIGEKFAQLSRILEEGEKNSEKDDTEEETEPKESEAVTALKSELAELSESLGKLDTEIQKLSREADELNKSINDLVLTAGVYTDELMRRVSGCLLEAREAVDLIKEDHSIAETTKPMIEAFASLLEASKGIVSDEMYRSMQTSVREMRRFTGMDGTLPDFAAMEETLKTDVSVLSDIESDAFISGEISSATLSEVTAGDVARWTGRVQKVRTSIGQFSYDKLVFDYSEMRPDRILCELTDGLKRTVAEGFLDLLIGSDKVSDKKIGVRTRPSDLLGKTVPEALDAGKILAEELGKESGAESFVKTDATGVLSGATELLEEGEVSIHDKLLLLLYVTEHFGSLFDRELSGQSALAYEQEYILCGNRSDAENLAETASKIMMVRMIPATAYVMSDSGLRAKATEMATALVGFTGLKFLTIIVKYMIMFAWSTEQALVETAAVLAGKKVPILTTSASYCIDSFDVSVITYDGIRDKVKCFKESEVCLLYGDYLCLFLLAVPCEDINLRAMDVIEENMRWAYDDTFLLENCITGFDARLVFSCPARYVGILNGFYADTVTPSGYGFVRSDSVSFF